MVVSPVVVKVRPGGLPAHAGGLLLIASEKELAESDNKRSNYHLIAKTRNSGRMRRSKCDERSNACFARSQLLGCLASYIGTVTL